MLLNVCFSEIYLRETLVEKQALKSWGVAGLAHADSHTTI